MHGHERIDHAGPTLARGGNPAEPFRSALQALPGGVLVVAADGTIALVNRQLERLFGYGHDELPGRPVDVLLPQPATAGPAAGSFADGALSRLAAGATVVGRRRDGTPVRVAIRVNPLRTEHGEFVVAAVDEVAVAEPAETASDEARRHGYERLLAEVSVGFINLPHDQVDRALQPTLGKIGEALGLDRCNFYRILPDGTLTGNISWERPGVPPIPVPVSAAQQFPWALERVMRGEELCFASVEDIPNPTDRAGYRELGTQSAFTMPLSLGGQVVGAFGVNAVRRPRTWDSDTLHCLRMLASAFSNVLARRQSDAALQEAHAELLRLRDRLHAENTYLRGEAQERLGTGPIIGQSEAIQQVLEQIRQVAATDSTVLLLGETGSGKELFATRIHELSARSARSMVRVNCAAIPATLMESELFGRERGAFTGAHAQQIGRFELADHSTIFLDEIGELPADIQVKLLRVLEERQLERLGSPKPIKVDTRVIAATHRNLERRIADGTFREDLFYRLNVFPIRVPPLRERVDDIPLLVWRFIGEFARSFGKRIDVVSRENMAALQRYAWPGNIRELRNVVERAMIVATGPRLAIPVPAAPPAPAGSARSDKLADVEREHVRAVLQATGWRIRGSGGAAERLGLRPTTLETRLARLGLVRPKPQ
jgi:formate hydrogenlyase transcriptional activator